MFSCQPEEWLPFGDPVIDIDPLALEIQQRLAQDASLPTPLSEIETSLSTIRHFLNNQSKNKEATYLELVEWIQWRRGLVVLN
jgi:hypothetical protein